MDYQFYAERNPAPELYRQIVALAPENPFYTPAFGAARRAGGATPWILGVTEDGRLIAGCSAFMTAGRISRRFEIQSMPGFLEEVEFWDELIKLCGREKVTYLQVNTFGSPTASVPPLGRELWRRARAEYVLDLTQRDPVQRLSSNHRRNVKRAEKAGAVLRCTTDVAACDIHAALIDASMARRKDRGEQVECGSAAGSFRPYLQYGAGELFQAELNGVPLSSVLVLTAARGGYYHSAGTTPAGMAVGASQFLICNVARELKHRGFTSFNLGGADADQEGLTRFKGGFGAVRVELDAAEFALANGIVGVMRSAMERLRAHSIMGP